MIEHLPYFLNHAPPSNAEGGTFNGLTVALSYLLASAGCYIALTLANYMAEAQSKPAARGLHWAAAFVLGSSIWSMHFIGMLAFHLKMNVDYDTPRTIFSMIFAIAAAYGVMSFIRMRQLTAPRIIAASLLLGASICSMHYIGMSAMTMDAWLQYRPDLYVVSVIIAIAASLAAMLIFRSHGQYQGHFRQTWRAFAAFIMGAAICGMHYTGMAAAVFVPFPICRRVEDQDFNLISLEVAVVTSVIFAVGFTAALQIRERSLWEGSQRKQKFPLGLLMLAFFLTLVSTLWGGANSVYVKWVLGINARQSVEYEDIGDRLDYLRSDMLHLIVSILSDPKGEGRIRYNQDIDDYESAIQKAITLAPSPVLRQSAEDVRSHMRLVEADEVKSFALAEDGKLSDAEASLSSDLYKIHVENYSAARVIFTKTSNDALGASLGAFVDNGAYNLYLSLFVLTLLPTTWLFALRAVRSWRQQMETTRSNWRRVKKNFNATSAKSRCRRPPP